MLDANGDAEAHLDIKEGQKDFKENENSTSLGGFQDAEWRAILTGASSGRSEPLRFAVRLSHYPVHANTGPLDGSMREGDYAIGTRSWRKSKHEE
jgi:hypothetical protein